MARQNLIERRTKAHDSAPLIERGNLGNAADIALEAKPLALPELAFPATLGLFRQDIQPPGDKGRRGFGFLRIAENIGIEHAENGRLLDDLAIVTAMRKKTKDRK